MVKKSTKIREMSMKRRKSKQFTNFPEEDSKTPRSRKQALSMNVEAIEEEDLLEDEEAHLNKNQYSKKQLKRITEFDENKLRCTVIYGLPCKFIENWEKGDKSHDMNIRAKIWKTLCKVEVIQSECLQEYNSTKEAHEPNIKLPKDLFEYYRR